MLLVPDVPLPLVQIDKEWKCLATVRSSWNPQIQNSLQLLSSPSGLRAFSSRPGVSKSMALIVGTLAGLGWHVCKSHRVEVAFVSLRLATDKVSEIGVCSVVSTTG